MRIFYVLLFATFVGQIFACQKDLEWESRLAVKQLIKATDSQTEFALAKVVSFGRYALPDIEQQLQGASIDGRLLLLEALRQIKDKEAIPFLQMVNRWDNNKSVREKAKEILDGMR